MSKIWDLVTSYMVMPGRQSSALVLAQVNSARQSLGMDELDDLPAGMCRKPGHCPVSISLSAYVGVDGVCFETQREARIVSTAWGTSWKPSRNGQYIAELPESVRCFVRDFDLGAYPNLIARPMPSQPRREVYSPHAGVPVLN